MRPSTSATAAARARRSRAGRASPAPARRRHGEHDDGRAQAENSTRCRPSARGSTGLPPRAVSLLRPSRVRVNQSAVLSLSKDEPGQIVIAMRLSSRRREAFADRRRDRRDRSRSDDWLAARGHQRAILVPVTPERSTSSRLWTRSLVSMTCTVNVSSLTGTPTMLRAVGCHRGHRVVSHRCRPSAEAVLGQTLAGLADRLRRGRRASGPSRPVVSSGPRRPPRPLTMWHD